MADENQNKNKIEWYNLKGDHNFEFQLLNTEVKEHFSIWDNATRKFLRGDLPEDMVTDKVKTYDEKYKFMKKVVFEQKHPDWRKVSKGNCYIIVDDTEYFISLPWGIVKTLGELKEELPNSLTHYKFKLKKNGTGIQTKYSLLNLGGCDPIDPSLPPLKDDKPSTPVKPISFNFKPKSNADMTPSELDALEQFLAQDDEFSEEQFKQIWLEQLPDSKVRIDFIYQTYKEKVSKK